LGLFAGATYVLGFTLLQQHTGADLRGRIFTTLLTLVRLCVMLALLMGPVLATIFNGLARAATGDPEPEVPTWSFFGFDLAIPGVRLTLWLASAIIFGAGVLAARSMQLGIRSSLREGWNDVRTGEFGNNRTAEGADADAGTGEDGTAIADGPTDEPPGEEAS
jgi:hypothetical protein